MQNTDKQEFESIYASVLVLYKNWKNGTKKWYLLILIYINLFKNMGILTFHSWEYHIQNVNDILNIIGNDNNGNNIKIAQYLWKYYCDFCK